MERRGKSAGPSVQPPPEHGADGDADQAEEAKLPVAQAQHVGEDAAPQGGRQQRQQAFEDQHKGQRGPEQLGHGVPGPSARLLHRDGATLLLRMPLKKSDEGSTTSTSDLLAKLDL